MASLLDWPKPQSVKDVHSFLGFANFYRRFVKGYSTVACPLTSLTRKGATFGWTTEADAAFNSLKLAFTSAPVLQHFQPLQPLTLEADASDFGLGCVLSQPDPSGELHPVAYYSRKFIAAKLNYPIYDKELLP